MRSIPHFYMNINGINMVVCAHCRPHPASPAARQTFALAASLALHGAAACAAMHWIALPPAAAPEAPLRVSLVATESPANAARLPPSPARPAKPPSPRATTAESPATPAAITLAPTAIPTASAPAPIAGATDAATATTITATAATAAATGAPAPAVTPPDFAAAYLDNPPPAYPQLSRRLGEQGRVMVRVLVDTAGAPESIELKSSSGSPRLDDAALAVVKRWRFVPARQGPRPVAAWVLVPITFSLKG